MLRTFSLYFLAALFMLAGVNHFVNPQTYLAMMPPYLPFHDALNYITGAAEIVGGAAVLIPQLRRAAGWGLIALLIAVFPANVHMALYGLPGVNIAPWILWLRLPLQLVLIAWVAYSCLSTGRQKVFI